MGRGGEGCCISRASPCSAAHGRVRRGHGGRKGVDEEVRVITASQELAPHSSAAH